MIPALLLLAGIPLLGRALDSKRPSNLTVQRSKYLSPLEMRLAVLLRLYQLDRVVAPAVKRAGQSYFSAHLLTDAVNAARALGMRQTVNSLRRHLPLPMGEAFGRTGRTVGQIVLGAQAR